MRIEMDCVICTNVGYILVMSVNVYYYGKKKNVLTVEEGVWINQTEQTAVFRGYRTNVWAAMAQSV